MFKSLKRNLKKYYFVTCERYVKFKFQCPEINLYWRTATPIRLPVICGCFCATTNRTAELRGTTETVWPAKPKIFYLVLYRKRLPTLVSIPS